MTQLRCDDTTRCDDTLLVMTAMRMTQHVVMTPSVMTAERMTLRERRIKESLLQFEG
jgi:hypothetical protein